MDMDASAEDPFLCDQNSSIPKKVISPPLYFSLALLSYPQIMHALTKDWMFTELFSCIH